MSNKDHGVGRILFLHREYELATIERSLALLSRLGRLDRGRAGLRIDVGANVGTVCISMVRSELFSGAVAFEPEPRNYSLLVRNVHDNGLSESIRCFNVALSSLNGVGAMELSANSGDHRIRTGAPLDRRARDKEDAGDTISVPLRRLDDVLSDARVNPRHITLLWIDVQGHEKNILEGAPGILRTGVPVIAEFWPYGFARAGVSPHAYAAYIGSNFSCFYDLADDPSRRAPADAVGGLFERYAEFKHFTEILLLRDTGVAALAST